jgi:hypothetical protein
VTRLRGRLRRAGKPASFPVIGLLSSRPTFGRIEPGAEIGSRATDGRPFEQALADFAVTGWRSNWISSRDEQPVALAGTRAAPPGAPSHGHAGT